MLDVRLIDAADALDWMREMQRLMGRAHQLETETHFDGMMPDLHWDAYRALNDAGALVLAGAFDDGKPVGYGLAYLARHQHYDMLAAMHDTLYLLPEYRKGMTARRLMRLLEDEAESRGAVCFFWHAKPDSTFEKMLSRAYAREEVVYRKDF